MAEPRAEQAPRQRWAIEGWLALGFVLLVAAAAYSVVLPALSDAPDAADATTQPHPDEPAESAPTP